jgi:hypothetical protein
MLDLTLQNILQNPQSILFYYISEFQVFSRPKNAKDFARLELEAFYFAIQLSTFYEIVKIDFRRNKRPYHEER